MLKTRIVPILLLHGNSVVKPVKFGKSRIVGDAITNVNIFSKRFADEMCILDINAAKERRHDLPLIKKLARQCIMPLNIGGGINDISTAEALFFSGADKITINTAFYSNPDLLSQLAAIFGSQAIVFSLDVVQVENRFWPISNNGKVVQNQNYIDVAKKAEALGAGEILLNCVNKDGTLQGYELEIIEKVSASVDVPIIAAGGCGSKEDCVAAVVHGASAVAAGSIFFWVGESIVSLKQYMSSKGIEVRLK